MSKGQQHQNHETYYKDLSKVCTKAQVKSPLWITDDGQRAGSALEKTAGLEVGIKHYYFQRTTLESNTVFIT